MGCIYKAVWAVLVCCLIAAILFATTVLLYGSVSRGLWVLLGFGLVVVIVPVLALGIGGRFWFGFFFEDLLRVLFGRRR